MKRRPAHGECGHPSRFLRLPKWSLQPSEFSKKPASEHRPSHTTNIPGRGKDIYFLEVIDHSLVTQARIELVLTRRMYGIRLATVYLSDKSELG